MLRKTSICLSVFEHFAVLALNPNLGGLLRGSFWGGGQSYARNLLELW